MLRPVKGRSIDAQHIPPLSAEHHPQPDQFWAPWMNTSHHDEGERPVWESALLPDVQNAPDVDIDLGLSSASMDTSMNDLKLSSMESCQNDGPLSENCFYEELSLLFEKWSNEDGLEPPHHFQACSSSSDSYKQNQSLEFNHATNTTIPHKPVVFENEKDLSFERESTNTIPNLRMPRTSVHQSQFMSPNRYCVFCKKNGETREFYVSHVIKDCKGHVICPILRDYVCPACGATGSTAHTLSYCPTIFQRKGKNSNHSW